ncbi:integrase core domain-containing protein [Streptomyces cyaneofuscatus]|uniref:integrase core domain-containing protein n=1 Tax=Streptomyces cyaneofuscatus TaxID=66883 RepID=UPI00365799DF
MEAAENASPAPAKRTAHRRSSQTSRTCSGYGRGGRGAQEAAAVASVGSRGDSYGNALAEAVNSLLRTELIRNRGPWTGCNDVEIAVAEYVDRFNQRRLHRELGHIPPAEFNAFHATTDASLTP